LLRARSRSPVASLQARLQRFGRHYERYLTTISAHLPSLLTALEDAALLDRVDLWTTAGADMDRQVRIVRDLGNDDPTRLDFMSVYYGLQFLQMNVAAVDRLELALSGRDSPQAAYRSFLESQATTYQRLNAAYIGADLDMRLEGRTCPRFALCITGTRSDQDDVDVMVLHEEGRDPAALNQALAKVEADFFRKAGRLHFYVAESMNLGTMTATIEQYSARLQADITNFVMISELLSGEPLLGDRDLFHRYVREIVDRFYGRKQRWRKFHEGFLRGLLGELSAMLVTPVRADRMDFKLDGIRLAKGIALAGKAVHGIREAEPLPVFDRLKEAEPKLAADFAALQESLVFVETARLLYQMLGVQEETVDLDSGSMPLLDCVATALGFPRETRGISPANHLVVRYFESVQRIRQICGRLLEVLTRHIRKLTSYSYAGNRDKGRNLALDLSDAVRTFAGHIFFDDVLDALKEGSGEAASLLVEDVRRLRPDMQDRALESFVALANSDVTTLLDLMLVLRFAEARQAPASKPDAGPSLFDKLFAALMEKTRAGAGHVPRVLHAFQSDPALFNRFIEALRPSQRKEFEDCLVDPQWDEAQREELARLRKYIWLRTAGSEFYRRVFRRVTAHSPQVIPSLGDTGLLRRYASGFLAKLPAATGEDSLDALIRYYDLSWLSTAIDALNGARIADYRRSFVESMDRYIMAEFAFRLTRAKAALGRRSVETGDAFAVFAAGGYARDQAFGDDIDLVLVLDSDDPELKSFYRGVWAGTHMDLIRRGAVPQYRFSDHFGEFVVPFATLRDWFSSGKADPVDRTHVLGLRLLVGSRRMADKVHREIVERHIWPVSAGFCRALAEEMAARWSGSDRSDPNVIDVKEAPGGLRDAEHIALMVKVSCKSRIPAGAGLHDALMSMSPDLAPQIAALRDCRDNCRRVRDLHRLAVAARDDVALPDLGAIASIMGLRRPDGTGDSGALAVLLRTWMAKIVAIARDIVPSLAGIDLP